MTTAASTATNAPRDLESLQRLGRYQLRKLAQDIGMCGTTEETTSLMSYSNQEVAAKIFEQLQELDGGAKASDKKDEVVRHPVTRGRPSAASKAAAAAAAAAAEGGADAAPSGSGPSTDLSARLDRLLATAEANARKLEELFDSIDNLTQVSSGNTRLTAVAINMSLILAEQSLGVGGDATIGVLQEAVDRLEEFEPTLAATLGSAGGK